MSLRCDIIQTVPHKTGPVGRRLQERILFLFRLVFGLLNGHSYWRCWKWEPCEFNTFFFACFIFRYTWRKTVTLWLFLTERRTVSKGPWPHVLQICQRLISIFGDTWRAKFTNQILTLQIKLGKIFEALFSLSKSPFCVRYTWRWEHSHKVWHSEDRASWCIRIIKPTRCTNFSNLFLE